MSEFEAEINQSIGMANANHNYRSSERMFLVTESQARAMVERVRRYELAARPQPKTDLDRRIDNLRAITPYILAAVCGIIGLILGQAM